MYWFSAEANAKYGKDKVKTYKASFSSLYFSMTERKQLTLMKLICVLPEEKVSNSDEIITKIKIRGIK